MLGLMLKGKKIVIGITGSIAAYKVPFLIRLLVKAGAEVQVIMTPAAVNFVTPLTLSTLSNKPVLTEPFNASTGAWNSHVDLGRWADLMLFAPVTANTLGKMAGGIADNFLVTAYLSAKCPVFIAPAMDLDMFNHPATQKSITVLRSFGATIIEPQVGELASGLSGPGRMEEPERIVSLLADHFTKTRLLDKKKVLVTAGPTYERIDPVRFIGNFSSGKMGFAIAQEAANRGAEVTLITGPTSLFISHPNIFRIDVESAESMYKACIEAAPAADFVIMAAAVADYTPKIPSGEKIKKSGQALKLDLTATRDILKELGRAKKHGQVVVGFALETSDGMANAAKKLKEKNLDFIVLNSLEDKGAGFGSDTNKVTILSKSGQSQTGVLKDKNEVASDILDVVTGNSSLK
jgi:phosphopantothenoylcysteine decarboxylase / phosphopantothenate---cysteine ligase